MAVENSTLFSLIIGDSITNNARGKGRWQGGSKEGWGKEGGYKRRVGGLVGGGREGGIEEGREGGGRGGRGARGWWGGREQVRERGRERANEGRFPGSDDARQAESVSGGRDG